MSSSLDLSRFFEKEDVFERKVIFTSTCSPRKLLARIEDTATQMGFGVQKKNGKTEFKRKTNIIPNDRVGHDSEFKRKTKIIPNDAVVSLSPCCSDSNQDMLLYLKGYLSPVRSKDRGNYE